MKRVQLEPWSTQEKLCLVSAIHKTGDQNWTAVSRATKNLFEETVNREPSPEVRPPEWFSMKQCAAQYENLLKTVATPRRKKRTEKGSEVSETPIEIIAGVLRLEFTEELKASINEDYAMYMKLKKEKEDAEAGLLDDKLEDLIAEYEARDREKEIKKKLKYKLGEKLSSEEMLKPPEVEPPSTPTHEPEVKPSSATSPLLTSLLQSPSPLTRPSMPSNASPTISLLLNSSPAVPASESPTLSKLLESPTSITGPISQPQTPSMESPMKIVPTTPPAITSPIKQEPPPPPQPPKEPTPPPIKKPPTPPPLLKEEPEEIPPKEPVEETEIKIEPDETPVVEETSPTEELNQNIVDSEVVIGDEADDKRTAPSKRLDIELEEEEPGDEVLETVEELIEKVEEVVSVTQDAGETSDEETGPDATNQTIESETLDDNLEHLELDHEAVELIVVGPNQAASIVTVCHETPAEAQNEPEKTDKAKEEDSVVADSTTEQEVKPEDEETSKEEKADVEVEEETEEIEGVTLKSTESKDETSSKISEEDGESKQGPEDYKTSPEGGVTEDPDEDEDEEVSEEADETPREDFSESSKDKPEQTDETMDSSEIDEPKTEKAEESSEEKENENVKKRKLSIRSEDEDEPPFITKEVKEDAPESPGGKARKDDSESVRRTAPQLRQEKISAPDTPTSQDQVKSPLPSSSKEEKKEETERRRGTRKRISVLSQSDSKPSSPASSLDEDKDYKMWKKSMLLEYNRLASHKYASAFSKPIREADAVGYHSVVKRPMDLSTIKKNIESGAIRTTVEFQRDLLLMVQNAIMYNKTSTLVYKMAQDMLVDIIDQLQIMVDAIGDGVSLATYDRHSTRGRASKIAAEESGKRKRSSIGEIEALRQSKRKKTDSCGST